MRFLARERGKKEAGSEIPTSSFKTTKTHPKPAEIPPACSKTIRDILPSTCAALTGDVEPSLPFFGEPRCRREGGFRSGHQNIPENRARAAAKNTAQKPQIHLKSTFKHISSLFRGQRSADVPAAGGDLRSAGGEHAGAAARIAQNAPKAFHSLPQPD